MKKKIRVKDARLGMFVDSLCGSWINHPFWKKSFLLDQQKDLDTLLSCGTEEMIIDTELGLDVKGPDEDKQAESPPASPQQLDLKKLEVREPPVNLNDELIRARKIHTQGRVSVTKMFEMALNKESVNLDGALVLVDEIRRSTSRNQNAFLGLIRSKEGADYLCQHSIAVCALMIILGRGMEMDQDTIMSLGLAGLMHDIGYTGFSSKLIDKPGKLAPDEFDIVHGHTRRGCEMLKPCNLDNIVMDVCMHHHERTDGKGYPDGLAGDAISLFARMAAVCDAYDYLISDNPPRKGISPANALRQMAKLQEGLFDKTVFHAFVRTVGMYPFGTLVKLKSGRVAVVEEQSKKSLTEPVVRVFYSMKMNEPIFQEWIDLSKVPDSIVSVEEADVLSKELRIDLKLMSIF